MLKNWVQTIGALAAIMNWRIFSFINVLPHKKEGQGAPPSSFSAFRIPCNHEKILNRVQTYRKRDGI